MSQHLRDIVFFCTGNTHRSPVAQRLLEYQLKNEGIQVDSFGLNPCRDTKSQTLEKLMRQRESVGARGIGNLTYKPFFSLPNPKGFEELEVNGYDPLYLTFTPELVEEVRNQHGVTAYTISEVLGEDGVDEQSRPKYDIGDPRVNGGTIFARTKYELKKQKAEMSRLKTDAYLQGLILPLEKATPLLAQRIREGDLEFL